jgi:hypothetical protein
MTDTARAQDDARTARATAARCLAAQDALPPGQPADGVHADYVIEMLRETGGSRSRLDAAAEAMRIEAGREATRAGRQEALHAAELCTAAAMQARPARAGRGLQPSPFAAGR